MTNRRYVKQHEFGSDWQVWDTKSKRPVATGLTEDEADEAAKSRNQQEDQENSQFV